MTYDNVNEILENNKIPKGYEEYAETLKKMHELATILRKKKYHVATSNLIYQKPKLSKMKMEKLSILKKEYSVLEKP